VREKEHAARVSLRERVYGEYNTAVPYLEDEKNPT
jgi:hypothetical protein